MGETQETAGQAPPNIDPSTRNLRRIRRTGHYCLLFLLAVFFVVSLATRDNPESPYGYLWGLAVAHLTVGRALSAAVGKEFGFNPWFVFFQASMIDFILLCYLWPLLVQGHRYVRRWDVVGPFLDRIHRSARRHGHRVGAFGDLGLLVFVLFPFWCTGPLVGACIGYLAGMPTWRVFTVVTLGNTAAVAAWIGAYDYLHRVNRPLALGGLAILMAIAVGGAIYRRSKNHCGRAGGT